jgi:hypothetical protein
VIRGCSWARSAARVPADEEDGVPRLGGVGRRGQGEGGRLRADDEHVLGGAAAGGRHEGVDRPGQGEGVGPAHVRGLQVRGTRDVADPDDLRAPGRARAARPQDGERVARGRRQLPGTVRVEDGRADGIRREHRGRERRAPVAAVHDGHGRGARVRRARREDGPGDPRGDGDGIGARDAGGVLRGRQPRIGGGGGRLAGGLSLGGLVAVALGPEHGRGVRPGACPGIPVVAPAARGQRRAGEHEQQEAEREAHRARA